MATILLDDGRYYVEHNDMVHGAPAFGILRRRRTALGPRTADDPGIGVYECEAPGKWVVRMITGTPASITTVATHAGWLDAVVSLWHGRLATAVAQPLE